MDTAEPFVERGYGPLTSIMMPTSFPPPPIVASDPTIEWTSPTCDSDEDSDDSSKLWDEDPQLITCDNNGKWPSEADLKK